MISTKAALIRQHQRSLFGIYEFIIGLCEHKIIVLCENVPKDDIKYYEYMHDMIILKVSYCLSVILSPTVISFVILKFKLSSVKVIKSNGNSAIRD